MRIAIGEIAHETNTFVAGLTTVDDFKAWEWSQGQEIIDKHRGVRDYLGGMLDAAERLGIEVAPTFAAFAYPSGTIARKAYESLRDELLRGIREAGEIDAVCLALHGAGVAEGINDLEGELLREVRRLVGPDLPVVVTLDLHGNLTQEMIKQADALLGVNFYPHTDSFERGVEAVELARRIVRGEVRPVMHLEILPMMITTTTTNHGPAKEINERCWSWEEKPGVIDCTFFHGFPIPISLKSA